MEKDPKPFEHEQDTQRTHKNKDDEITVPVQEEELTATKRPVERGAVRIEKDVVEEHQTLDVPVTNDEVNVTRRAVDRQAEPGDMAFEDETISVPIRGEDVDVEKRTRVSEEIDIDRSAVTHNEQVTDSVRREEVIVDGEGQIEREDTTDRRNRQ